jgi:hypothetical protein
MIKIPLNFKDLDGNEVTEEHYFHLGLDELIDLELGSEVKMSDRLRAITDSNDALQIKNTFKWLVELSYGTRVNGTNFEKNPATTAIFMRSQAYDAMFMKLLTNLDFATTFVAGFMPTELLNSAEARQAIADAGLNADVLQLPTTVVGSDNDKLTGLQHPRDHEGIFWPWAFRKPTSKELEKMSPVQMQDVYLRANSDWGPPASTPS